jgi:hypothetical protein
MLSEILSRIQFLALSKNEDSFRVSKADMILLASEFWQGPIPFQEAWTKRQELSKQVDETPQDHPDYVNLLQKMVETYPEADIAMHAARQELNNLYVRKGQRRVRIYW